MQHRFFIRCIFVKNLQRIRVMKKKKQSAFLAAKRLQRKLAMQAGYYDGRFREKVVKDKKKEYSRKLARKKVDVKKEEG